MSVVGNAFVFWCQVCFAQEMVDTMFDLVEMYKICSSVETNTWKHNLEQIW